MVFWTGYWRKVRVTRKLTDALEVWIRRGRCQTCGRSHALLPSFCLPFFRYGIEVIGPAVEDRVRGASMYSIAKAADLWQSTVRFWCRRHRERAELAVAVVAMLAASVVGFASTVVDAAEAVVLSAVESTVAVVMDREEEKRKSHWSALSLATDGMWLAAVETANSPRFFVFSDPTEERFMAVIDRNDEESPP